MIEYLPMAKVISLKASWLYAYNSLFIYSYQNAFKEKFFELVVCESSPSFAGHSTANNLSSKGINTTVIPDSAIYAVMSRIDKVIFSTHAIMANGGLVTHSGAYMIALAAQAHSVPVIVIGAVYKLTPLYPFDLLTYNELLSPQQIFTLEEGDAKENIQVIVPGYDYVPPEMVSLFITNHGG